MLSAKEVPVLEIADENGSLGLFKVASEWEGFKKLESLSGRGCLIGAPTEPEGLANCFDGLMAGISGIPIVKGLNVIAASPDLALIIKGSSK